MMQSCSICHEFIPLEDLTTVIGCGHCFHEACIDQWMVVNRKGTCPNCRSSPPKRLNVGYQKVHLECSVETEGEGSIEATAWKKLLDQKSHELQVVKQAHALDVENLNKAQAQIAELKSTLKHLGEKLDSQLSEEMKVRKKAKSMQAERDVAHGELVQAREERNKSIEVLENELNHLKRELNLAHGNVRFAQKYQDECQSYARENALLKEAEQTQQKEILKLKARLHACGRRNLVGDNGESTPLRGATQLPEIFRNNHKVPRGTTSNIARPKLQPKLDQFLPSRTG